MNPQPKRRPFLGMLFKCCNVYTRIYLNPNGDVFEGRCPRCGKRIAIRAGAGGSRAKFWTAE